MTDNYTILHCHSDMSNCVTNIDSITKYQEYVDRAKELNMIALAISEHGSVFDWYGKKEAIEKAGMKYIHAEEFYITEKINIDENGNPIKLRDNWHCLLIARNFDGVKELNRLASKSFDRKDGHYYYAPRIEFSDLLNTSDNIIISTACFRKGTPVLTSKGYVPIENIKAGDVVVNQYGEQETVNFPTQRKYSGDGYHIDFIGGKYIECTANHEFLTFKLNDKNKNRLKWVSAENLNINPGSEKHICVMPTSPIQYTGNDIIYKDEWYDSFFDSHKKGAKPRSYRLPDEIKITPEIMRLFGLFLGDGCISLHKNPNIGFTFNIKEYDAYWSAFIESASKQLGIKWYINHREDRHRVDIASSSRELIDLFYYLFGDVDATNKHIPNRLKHISKELDMELFFGYMLADGYFREKKFSKSIQANGSEFVAASISFNLMNDMKDILDSLHITSDIRKSKGCIDKQGVNHRDSWYLYSRAYDIGSISKLSENSHEKIIEIFNSAIQKFEHRDYITVNNVLYKKMRIKSRTPIKLNETVYCLNNNTHSFVCNGVVVHNCLGGILNRAPEEIQKQFLDFMVQHKDRCFLEIQHHDVLDQKKYNQKLYKLSQKYGLQLVACTDTHSLNDEHAEGRKILQLSKNIHFGDEDGWDLTFKSYDELCNAYEKQNSLPREVYLEAIENTNKIADMIEPFDIDKKTKYPHIYDNPDKTFKAKINEAYKNHPYLRSRYPSSQVIKRIREEYEVYKKVGAIDFMLLETYLREWERDNGIQCGYGRGSVSGSLIAYALGITQMDSIKFNLNFFRFMNPGRVTNADIDTDYCSKDRDKIKYFLLHDKMNLPNIKTSEIITFNTIATKGAIKDVCRALNISLAEAQQISDAVNIDGTIDDKWKEQYPEVFRYVDIVSGTIVSIGSHPSGVLVSDRDIEADVGLCSLSTSDYSVSMLDMHGLDDQMYVKLDILGLDNIGVINECCKLVGIDRLTPDNVDLEDETVWRSIRDDTTMIFQWESDSAAAYLKKFMSDDIIAKAKARSKDFSYIKWFSFGNGLLRPACASYRDEVANGVFYDNGFKELNDFLAPEAGRVCMQETIMQFLVKFCGYSNAESDNVRRGIAKKKGTEQLLPEIERRFIDYSSTHYDITKERCQEVIKPFLDIILAASSYAFSWNHSDAYSCIGYISGFLRYYYPLEFLTAAFNTFTDKEDKIVAITKYADKVGIKIQPPKFRHSRSGYQMDKETKSIYKGLESIKYLNADVSDQLYKMRDTYFNSFIDFLNVCPLNSRQLDILVKLDFFSEFGKSLKLLEIIDLYNLLHGKKQIKKEKSTLPTEILEKYTISETAKMYKFDDEHMDAMLTDLCSRIPNIDIPLQTKLQTEQEMLGYISYTDSSRPNSAVIMDLNTKYSTFKAQLYRLSDGQTVTVKIKRKLYEQMPIAIGMVIKYRTETKPGWRKDENDQWQIDYSKTDTWLTSYDVEL